jgi:hypothetical protein
MMRHVDKSIAPLGERRGKFVVMKQWWNCYQQGKIGETEK